MTRLVSTNTKIEQLAGLLGTNDLKDREDKFVRNVVAQTDHGKRVGGLTDPQLEWIDDLWKRHFA